MRHWALSRHLSWFAQREHRYLYHDLTGEILEVGPLLAPLLGTLTPGVPFERDALIEAFLEARTSAATHTAPDPHALAHALDELAEHDVLVEPDCDELERLLERVPVKARWRVVYHDPDTDAPLAVIGRAPHVAPQLLRLDDRDERALWFAIDGEQSLLQLARTAPDAGPIDDHALRARALHFAHIVARWTHSDLQLTRLSRVPLSFYRRQRAIPGWLESTMPFERIDGPLATIPDAPQTIAHDDYHQSVIHDANHQFDEVETTLSHLFREPHPALGGRTYAAAFVDALVERGLLDADTHQVLEVGGGVGFFAEGFLERLATAHPALLDAIHYRILDLSPALRQSQAARLARFGTRAAVIAGNGEFLEGIAPASLDLIVSNEVIADFTTVRLTRRTTDDARHAEAEWLDPDDELERLEAELDDDDDGGLAASATVELDGPAPALEFLAAHPELSFDDAPSGDFLFNLGAARFVEAIARALRPGGAAVVTEFGDRWRYPVESLHLDHAEVSIHFGHLLDVARAVGLEAELVDVPDLIGLDGTGHRSLATTRTYFRNLCFLAARHGARLQKIAYTPESLALACAATRFDPARVETLDWRPLQERVHGLVPHEFKALVLRRPARG